MRPELKTIMRVLAEKDETKRAALMERSDAELSAFFSKPHNHALFQELAFSLVGQVWKDVMVDDVTPRIIEVKTVGLDQEDFIEEDLRGLRAYWQGKGGNIRSGTLRYSRERMPREEMVAAHDAHIDEIATSFWGTVNDLRSQYNEKLRQLPIRRLVELIGIALPDPSTVDTLAVTGSFAAATLDDSQIDPIIQNVRRFSKGQVSIVGSQFALASLANIGLQYGDKVAEEVFRTGQIGQYKGSPVVQIENFEDFDGSLALSDDELWIVGQNAGRLTYYGNQAKTQVLQLPAFRQRWETARDAGMLLYGAEQGRLGRVILT